MKSNYHFKKILFFVFSLALIQSYLGQQAEFTYGNKWRF